MTKTEDTIAMLRQLIKHLEGGHEVVDLKVARGLGEPQSASLYGPEFSSIVDIRIEYKKAQQ